MTKDDFKNTVELRDKLYELINSSTRLTMRMSYVRDKDGNEIRLHPLPPEIFAMCDQLNEVIKRELPLIS